MAEETNIMLVNDNQGLGDIQISREVLEIIAGIAASEIDGVYRMRGSLANSVNELLGRPDHGKGVKLALVDDEVTVDVFVYLNYGVSVPKVALKIQDNIKQQISLMTDLKIREVNVHIEGVIPEKTENQVDPNNLFGDENGDK